MLIRAALATLFALAAVFPLTTFGDETKPVSPGAKQSADPLAPYEHWITGQIFIEDGVLMFRADKPIRGNPRKDVVELGVTKDAKGLLPIYVSAATATTRKFRLFGALTPCSDTFKGHPGLLPNVQFITWKMHLPGDPDVSPDNQRITFDGWNASMNGKPVILKDAKGKDIEAETTLKIDHSNSPPSSTPASAP